LSSPLGGKWDVIYRTLSVLVNNGKGYQRYTCSSGLLSLLFDHRQLKVRRDDPASLNRTTFIVLSTLRIQGNPIVPASPYSYAVSSSETPETSRRSCDINFPHSSGTFTHLHDYQGGPQSWKCCIVASSVSRFQRDSSLLL
jgi:hypothetical protein